jgi:hypothetical protein
VPKIYLNSEHPQYTISPEKVVPIPFVPLTLAVALFSTMYRYMPSLARPYLIGECCPYIIPVYRSNLDFKTGFFEALDPREVSRQEAELG